MSAYNNIYLSGTTYATKAVKEDTFFEVIRPPTTTTTAADSQWAAHENAHSGSFSDRMTQLALEHPLCRNNVTAYAGQTAKLYCCIARLNRELTVDREE